jgi:peroxiredoxin
VREAGAELVAISPQTAQHSREFAEQRKLRFPVLHDPGNAVAERYGLTYEFSEGFRELYMGFGIDLGDYNGDDSWVLPIPGRFIVDSGEIIRYAEADPDYMIRPEPADTLEALKDL